MEITVCSIEQSCADCECIHPWMRNRGCFKYPRMSWEAEVADMDNQRMHIADPYRTRFDIQLSFWISSQFVGVARPFSLGDKEVGTGQGARHYG